MKTRLTKVQLEAWRSFYILRWKVLSSIEADLAAAGLPALSWYDVMYELYLAEHRRMRMSDLASGALLSRSGLTRLVDKLEEEKLIVRQACPEDGRALYAALTEGGVALLRRMWRVYREGIARYFAAGLSDAEVRQLGELLRKASGAA